MGGGTSLREVSFIPACLSLFRSSSSSSSVVDLRTFSPEMFLSPPLPYRPPNLSDWIIGKVSHSKNTWCMATLSSLTLPISIKAIDFFSFPPSLCEHCDKRDPPRLPVLECGLPLCQWEIRSDDDLFSAKTIISPQSDLIWRICATNNPSVTLWRFLISLNLY